jgi:hypothetical protein
MTLGKVAQPGGRVVAGAFVARLLIGCGEQEQLTSWHIFFVRFYSLPRPAADLYGHLLASD